MKYNRLTILLLALLAPAALAAASRRATTSLARAFGTLSLSSHTPTPFCSGLPPHSVYRPQPSMLAVQRRHFYTPPFGVSTPKKSVKPTVSLSRKNVLDAFDSVAMSQTDFVFIQKTGVVQKLVNAEQLNALQLIARINLEIALHYRASEQKGSAWPIKRRMALLRELAKSNSAVLEPLEAIFKISYPDGTLNTITVTKKDIFRAIIDSSQPKPYPALLHSNEATEMSDELAASLTRNFDSNPLSIAAFVINLDTIVNHFFEGVQNRFRRQDERGDARPGGVLLNDFLQQLLTAAGHPDALHEAKAMVNMLYPERSSTTAEDDPYDDFPYYMTGEAQAFPETRKPKIYDEERVLEVGEADDEYGDD